MAERKPKPTQKDYQMDVLLRQYCRLAEENEIIYEELDSMREAFSILLQENADLRHMMKEASMELPASSFEPLDNLETELTDSNTVRV